MPNEFAYLELVEDWPELKMAIAELETRWRAAGRIVAANMLVRAYAEFRDELKLIAVQMAAFATDELRKEEARTRVRPDTMGDGGPRLGDSLIAEPLQPQDLYMGSVGVANMDELDKNVPWWVTNEVGNDTRASRHDRIFGVFWGAGQEDMPPDEDAGAMRTHPLFTPAGAESGGGPGVIRNPIPARYFIRDAIPKIRVEFRARLDAAKARYMEQFRRAEVTFR